MTQTLTSPPRDLPRVEWSGHQRCYMQDRWFATVGGERFALETYHRGFHVGRTSLSRLPDWQRLGVFNSRDQAISWAPKCIWYFLYG